MLTALEVKVHFTKPYSGQSKPIERAFGDFARDIAMQYPLLGTAALMTAGCGKDPAGTKARRAFNHSRACGGLSAVEDVGYVALPDARLAESSAAWSERRTGTWAAEEGS